MKSVYRQTFSVLDLGAVLFLVERTKITPILSKIAKT